MGPRKEQKKPVNVEFTGFFYVTLGSILGKHFTILGKHFLRTVTKVKSSPIQRSFITLFNNIYLGQLAKQPKKPFFIKNFYNKCI